MLGNKSSSAMPVIDSTAVAPPPKPTAPQRAGRHPLKRSLTEFPPSANPFLKEALVQAHEAREPVPVPAVAQSQPTSYKPRLPFRKEKHSDNRASNPASHALSNLRHSLDMARSEMAPSANNPSQNRRPSVSGGRNTSRRQSLSTDRDAANETQLLWEQEAASLRTAGLKQAVRDLSLFSTTTTEQLDSTYHSIQEKISSLQGTISALRELADSSREVCSAFEKESQGLEHDVVTQLSKFAYLGEQESKIEGLHGRIKTEREKMKALSKRVDRVRAKIEGWDRADQEWQQRTRKRLMWLWSCGTVATLLLIALLLGVRYTSPEAAQQVTDEISKGIHKTGETFSLDGPLADALLNMTREALPRMDDSNDALNGTLNWKKPVIDGERLRALDEL